MPHHTEQPTILWCITHSRYRGEKHWWNSKLELTRKDKNKQIRVKLTAQDNRYSTSSNANTKKIIAKCTRFYWGWYLVTLPQILHTKHRVLTTMVPKRKAWINLHKYLFSFLFQTSFYSRILEFITIVTLYI